MFLVRTMFKGFGSHWGAAAVLVSSFWGAFPAHAGEMIALVRPHGETVYYDRAEGEKAFPKVNLTEQFTTESLTFNITYEDMNAGFTDPVTGPDMRGRLEDVLAYVAEVINAGNRTLDIQVTASQFDGTGPLATAGTFFPVSGGFHRGSTLQRLATGVKPFPGFPEISITVDVGFAWNVSEADPAPGTADFFSVLLHEVTHGLGFTSLIEQDGSSSVGVGAYSFYDSLLTSGANGLNLLSGGNPPAFQTSTTALTSDDIWFNGTQAVAMYGLDAAIPVYAPSPYEPGSSTSHWDINALQSPSVMTHAIILGTAQRKYAAVDLGALIDLGYTGISGQVGVSGSSGVAGCVPADGVETSRASGGGGVMMVMLIFALLVSTWAMQFQSAPRQGGK